MTTRKAKTIKDHSPTSFIVLDEEDMTFEIHPTLKAAQDNAIEMADEHYSDQADREEMPSIRILEIKIEREWGPHANTIFTFRETEPPQKKRSK